MTLRTVVEAVGVNDLLGLVEDVGHVDTNDLLGTGLSSEHGENTSAASDLEQLATCGVGQLFNTYVKNDLVLEEVLVLEDGVAVREGADLVLEHLLVDAEVSVRVGVAGPMSVA
jgi:hypothetical protein